ncbi:MAG: exodeoxyribonuclease V subunit alpha [Gammaproteobacteria bacterium]|nr:exodeoxyribonuclease V subunit alpha [Gammaproteobacteria bacterium]
MNDVIKLLRQAGLSELACQFAAYIQRHDSSQDQLVALTAGLVSDAVSQGHVCLNLQQASEMYQGVSDVLPEITEWQTRLKNSAVVGADNEYRPLILTENGLVYLYRYWQDERHVAKAIKQRSQTTLAIDSEQLKQDFSGWNSSTDGIDWQKVAVIMALSKQFCVISGGPGTGKTTIVLRIIQSLLKQSHPPRIALAAPTGKAAARLQQSIGNSDSDRLQAKTLHRLLGISAQFEQGRYDAERPLPFDVVIVDEASMIDISLMAKLLHALAPSTRLVLLGDSQQLASVESGAVLANLCEHAMTFSQQFADKVKTISGIELKIEPSTQTSLSDSVVTLQQSYRFAGDSDIGRLAQAIQAARADDVIELISNSTETVWHQQPDLTVLIAGYHAYFDLIKTAKIPLECIKAFDGYRVLCALKQGPYSVVSVNQLIEQNLARHGWRSQQDFYHGRPIMISQNDYRQQLFNGDTGLILKDDSGDLRACFLIDNTLRWVDLSRLPAHETAYAMTIHKSQGSEFDAISVLLPDQDNSMLNRELLYTAITRAKKQLMIVANEAILRKTISTQHQRESGLAQLLAQ